MHRYRRFQDYTRCPLLPAGDDVSDDALDRFLLERYIDNALHEQRRGPRAWVRSAYYAVRPILPVAFRKYLQRLALRNWSDIGFPDWPVDTSVDDRIVDAFGQMLDDGTPEIPFVWFWPHGHRYAGIMTHDVETRDGRDFTRSMIQMESEFEIRSAFEIVPEVRYDVPETYLQSIRDAGCEVCLHGLNHDGRLFDDPEQLAARVDRLEHYAKSFEAIGFRSPIMYRNVDWLPKLPVQYDMSLPNTGRLDPQRGGCCTVMPYFMDDLLELPLTTIQDYSLLHVLDDYSLAIWRRQRDLIRRRFGLMSFIIHPDYTIETRACSLYRDLLAWLDQLRREDNLWLALPREVNGWWRRRRAMRIEKADGRWHIVGDHRQEAVLAFARRRNGGIRYVLANGAEYDAQAGPRRDREAAFPQ